MTQYMLAAHQREGDPIPSDEEIQQAYGSRA